MSNADPNGLRFYDAASQRDMLLVQDEASEWNGWLCWRHPDGQWVSLRKATEDDLARLSAKEQLRQMVRDGATFVVHEPAGAEVAQAIKQWAGDDEREAKAKAGLRRAMAEAGYTVGAVGGAVQHGRTRPAREVLDLAADAFCEGFVAGLEAVVANHYSDDADTARETWERSEVKRTLSEPGAEYIWRFGADGQLHKQLDAAEESLGSLRDAVRELLATDGGDGLYDGSRFSVAREECRRLVPRSE